jgi:DNA mismatch repair protein MutS
MDEVGRGTGASDGLSIAWAVSEDLLDRVKCRTLFATHYHELSRMQHPRLVNRSMEVDDQGGEIVFLRKLIEGAALRSYGLHVARLAGLPRTVLERAGRIMAEIEGSGRLLPGADIPARETAAHEPLSAVPAESRALGDELLNALLDIDLNALTPMEALMLLNDWKRQAVSGAPDAASGSFNARGKTASAQPKSKKPSRHDPDSPGLFDS